MAKIMGLCRRPAAWMLCFLLAFGVTIGFSAEKAWAADPVVTVTHLVSPATNQATVSFTFNSNGNTLISSSLSASISYQRTDITGQTATTLNYGATSLNTSGVGSNTMTLSGLATGGTYVYTVVVTYTPVAGSATPITKMDTFVVGSAGSITSINTPWQSNTTNQYESTLLATANITGTVTNAAAGFFALPTSYGVTSGEIANTSYSGYLINIPATLIGSSITSVNNVHQYFANTSQQYYVWAYTNSGGVYRYSPALTYNNSYGAPTVETTYARNSSSYGYISAAGYINNIGNNNITQYGFVYSTTNSTPTINGSNCQTYQVGTSISSSQSFYGDFVPQSGSNSSYQNYYVRAYAINDDYYSSNNNNIGYGVTQTVTQVPVNYITVGLGSLRADSATSGSATISVSGVSASYIYDWGLVYSETNKTPTYNGTNCFYSRVNTSSNSTSATVTMDNLKPNTTYYVRAYARTSNGNSYSYSSSAQNFTTPISLTITTNSGATNITAGSATVSGNISSSGTTNYISEKGFVYSRTNSLPTISDSSVKHTNTQAGAYSSDLSFLVANAMYYVRAYVKTTTGSYEYSDTATTFNTKTNTAVLSITYRDANGFQVGTQSINTTVNTMLSQKSLTIPSGYRLQNDIWTYSVKGNDTINLQVISTSGAGTGITPTPPPTNPTPVQPTGAEQAYMTANGMNFSPDSPATVMEVAAVLYSLLADPTRSYTSPYSFPDVNYGNALTGQIVNFVSSQGYMIGNDLFMFRPTASITRAEIATIICEVKKYMNDYKGSMPIPSAYPDTNGHWAQGYIYLAAINQAFGGYSDGTFKPNNNVTRAEIAQIFTNVFNRSGNPLGSVPFNDVPPSHWAYNVIMNAAVPQY